MVTSPYNVKLILTLTILMHQMRISTTQVFSDAQVEKVGNPKKKMWKLKEPSDENQTECHGIEPNLSKDRAMSEGDIPSFWDEFTNLLFSWQFNSYSYIKASTEVLSNWAVETPGD
jgi:hypothetical protein